MDSQTIIEVIDKLVGKTMAIGDSSADEHRIKNLKTLFDITNWCLDEILGSAETRHSPEGSIRGNGELAYSYLLDTERWLGDIEQELA